MVFQDKFILDCINKRLEKENIPIIVDEICDYVPEDADDLHDAYEVYAYQKGKPQDINEALHYLVPYGENRTRHTREFIIEKVTQGIIDRWHEALVDEL